MSVDEVPRSVLWAATVRTKPLNERIAAAVSAGYDAMSVFPIDLANWEKQGLAPQQVGRRIANAGLAVAALDPFTQWVPKWTPPTDLSEEDRAFVDFDIDTIFRLASAIGAETINCVEPFGDRHSDEALIDAFVCFADRAGSEGFNVALEFMPISGIPDLSTGAAVVTGVDRAHAGLVFDVWHFVRSGSGLADLDQGLARRIFEVQVADGRIPMTGDDLMDDLLHHRLAPREGDFPLAEIATSLNQFSALRSVGPELFSDAMDGLSAHDAASTAIAATRTWCDDA